ncbi:hypothetical protein E3J62_09460 [candidate division TA06 bacterium]|uniref:Exo-alpha-sialidase n=1 Tax=candidate division TA06 bacterium TaxID=2250710 RepID=A0A523UQG2_UNCT6|nr:MAG: hypothetical protein E3J62_09460 [candidate division TA06 bacterium]
MARRLIRLVLFISACSMWACLPEPKAKELVPEPGWVKQVIAEGDGYPGGIAVGNAILPPKPAIHYIYCAKGNGDLVAFSTTAQDPTNWPGQLLKAGVGYEGVFIGPGRNDGNHRLYCVKDEQLWEVFSSDGGLTWTDVLMLQITDTQWDYVIIGSGRNDGVDRVYATDKLFNIYEFTFNHGTGLWEWTTYNEGVRCEAIGPGRNDVTNRIYGVGPAGGEELTINELTYQSGVWVKTVPAPYTWDWGGRTPFTSILRGVTLAPARGPHDNHKLHIYYQNPYDGVGELTWDPGTSSWQNSTVLLNMGTNYAYGTGIQQWGTPFAYGKIWHETQPILHKLLWIGGIETSSESPSYLFGFAHNPGTGEWDYVNLGVAGKHGLDVEVGDVRECGDYGIYVMSMDWQLVEFYLEQQ